jgi:glutamate N-acetyltransferase / amino-acid N-acetyltransferase
MNQFLPKGFFFSGLACGLKSSRKKDLGLIYSQFPCNYAGVFTQNSVQAHCVADNKKALNNNIQAILVNSGNANACTGNIGMRALNEVKDNTSQILQIDSSAVLTASTGVIGIPLPVSNILQTLPKLIQSLDSNIQDFSEAILTTDLKTKVSSLKLNNGQIIGIAKGSGMIHPNMATMLAFILTDFQIEQAELQKALNEANAKSFNQISVDGDTSTNDMVLVLANGASGQKVDTCEFQKALTQICISLAKQIVLDGEGATKIFEVKVIGSPEAAKIAKGIASSSLVKSAIFGADPNWGRILASAGQYGALNINEVTLKLLDQVLFAKGQVQQFDKKKLAQSIKEQKEINIELKLSEEITDEALAWGCDLTYDYVRINAEYTT